MEIMSIKMGVVRRLMEKSIMNFHFVFFNPSLSLNRGFTMSKVFLHLFLAYNAVKSIFAASSHTI